MSNELEKQIRERIKNNILRDYGRIQEGSYLRQHIEQHQNHKGNLFDEYVKPYFPKGYFENKKVLEVGCGFGGNVIHLNSTGCDAMGIDIDVDAIEIAKMQAELHSLHTDAFLSCSAEQMTTVIHDKFDTIISIQVLEHVNDVEKVMKEMLMLLKKGGYLYIHVPNYDSNFETHYRLQLPNGNKDDFIRMLEKEGINTKFAHTLNFVNKRYFEDIISRLSVSNAFILPYDNESFRKAFKKKSRRWIVNILSSTDMLCALLRRARSIYYRFKIPDSLIVLLQK